MFIITFYIYNIPKQCTLFHRISQFFCPMELIDLCTERLMNEDHRGKTRHVTIFVFPPFFKKNTISYKSIRHFTTLKSVFLKSCKCDICFFPCDLHIVSSFGLVMY